MDVSVIVGANKSYKVVDLEAVPREPGSLVFCGSSHFVALWIRGLATLG